MGSSFIAFFTNLITQLPLLILYIVGLLMAFDRLAQQPKTARRTIVAFAILLLTAVGMTGVSSWLPSYLAEQGSDAAAITSFLRWIYLASNLLHTLAMGLILAALFRGEQATATPNWLRLILGGLLGLLLGGVLGALLGDPIGAAFQVSNFEGGRGFFVAFFIIPLFAVIGAITGAIVLSRRAVQK